MRVEEYIVWDFSIIDILYGIKCKIKVKVFKIDFVFYLLYIFNLVFNIVYNFLMFVEICVFCD